jgi:predicted dehydrogenase
MTNHKLPNLMVGFNRRFSSCVKRIKSLLENRKEPLCMTMTVNAGFIPSTHWIQDLEIGGGRIIGEICHFIDLLSFITASAVSSVQAITTKGYSGTDEDKVSILLKFQDGSIGSINYFTNGNKSYPKEKLEIFSEGKTIVLNNFKSVKSFGFGKLANFSLLKQDKGHKNEVRALVESLEKGYPLPISFKEIVNITLSTFAVVDAIKGQKAIDLRELEDQIGLVF